MKTQLLLCIALLLSLQLLSQTQIGQNVLGEDEQNLSGTSIAINNLGNFMVVGAPRAIIGFNGGVAIKGGHVRTYASNGTSWTAGADFDAKNVGDSMGFSVAVNGEGSIIACGAPTGNPNGTNSGYVHVYIAQGNNPILPNNYIRLGVDLEGENTADRFGQSIALNDAGTRLIIGAPGGNYVKIFEKENFGDPWTQLGQTLSGGSNSDLFGTSVDINESGNRIVIGAISDDDGGTNAGSASIYELQNNSWVLLGTKIDGATGNQTGNAVNIDDVGDTVAIGFPGLQAAGVNNSGTVKVFDLINSQWQQRGNNIVGRAFEAIGGSGNNQQEGAIDLHAGGTRIAIGSKTFTDGNVTQKGFIALYEYNNGVWSKKGNDVTGTETDEEFGTAVAINDSDGTIIASGAPFADINGSDRGYAAVYDFKNVLSTTSTTVSQEMFSIYPNPSSTRITVKGKDIKQVTIINAQGKVVKTSTSKIIDISVLSTGVYFVKTKSSNNNISYKKLMIQ